MRQRFPTDLMPLLEAVAKTLAGAGFRNGDESEPGLDLILEGL